MTGVTVDSASRRYGGTLSGMTAHRLTCHVRAPIALVIATLATLATHLTPHALAAQAAPGSGSASPLTIERLTGGPSLTGTSPAAPAWSPTSRTLVFLWHPTGGARTLHTVNRDGSALRRLLPASDSAPVSAFLWLPSGESIVYVQRGELKRLAVGTPDAAPVTVTTAPGETGALDVSPDGRWLSFLRGGDLWLLPLDGALPAAPQRITTVAREPIGSVPLGTYFRRDVEIGPATWGGDPVVAWSPDARTIAVHHVDRRAVPTLGMPYYLSDTALLNQVRRSAPGQVNEVRKVALVDVASRALSFVELPDSSTMRVVNFAWNPAGTLLIDRETDDAITRTVHTVVPGAAPRLAWRDTRDTRIYNDIHSAWSADGRAIVLTGDLDERYRLYRLVPGDTAPRALTQSDADVAGPAIARAASRSLDYVSSAPRPSERHVWRVGDAGGAPRQLTTRAGVHSPYTSPDGRTIALISSSDTVPPELYLLDVRAGATERRITVSPPADFARVPWIAARYATFPSRTNTPPLHARILLPPGLDTTRRHPVLFGPVYSNTVRNRWAGTYGMLQQYLALARGYIVVQVDVRGSTGYGRPFREAFLNDWGGQDLEDLASAVDWLATVPYVDTARLGIWGSSYGGTLTVYGLLRKPGLFKAGVAGAPATDPYLFGSDDVAIVRRPQTHPEVFARGALQYAGNLRDHLLHHPRHAGRCGALLHVGEAVRGAAAARGRTSTSRSRPRRRTAGRSGRTTRATCCSDSWTTSTGTSAASDRADRASWNDGGRGAQTAAPRPLSFQHQPAAPPYFVAFARSRIASAIARTLAASFAPATSLSTCAGQRGERSAAAPHRSARSAAVERLADRRGARRREAAVAHELVEVRAHHRERRRPRRCAAGSAG